MHDLTRYNTILLFGGSFDPPHWAHTALPRLVAEHIGADVVAYLPAGRAPHKLDREQTDPQHRLAMLRLAQADEPGALHYEYYMPPDRSTCTVLERYADNANTVTKDGYSRVDLGATYQAAIAGKKVAFRLNIENVLDTNYLAGGGINNVTIGEGSTARFEVKTSF